eukprot:TRINITY_DN11687_c2_g1_i2.p1 TRINITY_DN11687_c2_g1~~TRINITY_DN11687_c2_g1_i2.p1  ORF type:complete len:484 (+),score=147.09 TRINITY_DN11687_c2_g1_i2:85-1452(+)
MASPHCDEPTVSYADLTGHFRGVHSKIRKRFLRAAPDAATLQACSARYESLIATLRRQGQVLPEATAQLSAARVYKARGDFLSEAQAYARAGRLFISEETRRFRKGVPSTDSDLSRGVMACYFATRGFAAHGDELGAHAVATQCATTLSLLGCEDAALEYWETGASLLEPAAAAAARRPTVSSRGPSQQVLAVAARRAAFEGALRCRDFAKAQSSGAKLLQLLQTQGDAALSPRSASGAHLAAAAAALPQSPGGPRQQLRAPRHPASPRPAAAPQEPQGAAGPAAPGDAAGDEEEISFTAAPPRDFMPAAAAPLLPQPATAQRSRPSGPQQPGWASRVSAETQLRLLLVALVQKDHAAARRWLGALSAAGAAAPDPPLLRLLGRLVGACEGEAVWGRDGPQVVRLLCDMLGSVGIRDPLALQLAGTASVAHNYPLSLPPTPAGPAEAAAAAEVTV